MEQLWYSATVSLAHSSVLCYWLCQDLCPVLLYRLSRWQAQDWIRLSIADCEISLHFSINDVAEFVQFYLHNIHPFLIKYVRGFRTLAPWTLYTPILWHCNGDNYCLEVRRENNHNCFVLCCVRQLLCTMIRTHTRVNSS